MSPPTAVPATLGGWPVGGEIRGGIMARTVTVLITDSGSRLSCKIELREGERVLQRKTFSMKQDRPWYVLDQGAVLSLVPGLKAACRLWVDQGRMF
jgi:hypothetical protein